MIGTRRRTQLDSRCCTRGRIWSRLIARQDLLRPCTPRKTWSTCSTPLDWSSVPVHKLIEVRYSGSKINVQVSQKEIKVDRSIMIQSTDSTKTTWKFLLGLSLSCPLHIDLDFVFPSFSFWDEEAFNCTYLQCPVVKCRLVASCTRSTKNIRAYASPIWSYRYLNFQMSALRSTFSLLLSSDTAIFLMFLDQAHPADTRRDFKAICSHNNTIPSHFYIIPHVLVLH